METNNANITVDITFLKPLTREEENMFVQGFMDVLAPNTLHLGGNINSDSFSAEVDLSESNLGKDEIMDIINHYLDARKDLISVREVL